MVELEHDKTNSMNKSTFTTLIYLLLLRIFKNNPVLVNIHIN